MMLTVPLLCTIPAIILLYALSVYVRHVGELYFHEVTNAEWHTVGVYEHYMVVHAPCTPRSARILNPLPVRHVVDPL